MKASEFTTEDNFGTHPKRPARTGSRHPRGHQPVPRYKTITAQDSDNTAESVAEGLSKRDQKDVAAIRAAIARLEAQLNHPNADRDAIQQSIAHEKKRLALYGQGVAEGNQEEKIGGRYDADEFDSMVARLKKLAGAGPMRTVYDPDRRVYRNMPSAQQPAQQPKKAPR